MTRRGPHHGRDHVGPALLGLLDGPDLPGAACKHLAPLFDAELDGEPEHHRVSRLRLAQKTCAPCPARAACAAAAADMKPPPRGVWGGQIYERPKPGRRPRQAS